MEKEIARHRCRTDDGGRLDVVELQHFRIVDTDMGVRHYPGARRTVTANGEPVRYVDNVTFEIVDTGELVHKLD